MPVLPFPAKSHSKYSLLVVVSASLVALVGARRYAGGWNDGTRLATVESLVDRHTLIIDESIFVAVPKPGDAQRRSPYPPDDQILQHGTRDKLFVRGRYFSDKPQVLAILMAVLYQILQWTSGLCAAQHPSLFVYLMTILTSGLSYVVGALCIYRLADQWSWSQGQRLFFTASFALGTIALAYSRQVNGHIVLLGATAALTLAVVRWPSCAKPHVALAIIGALAGFAYTLDLGVGPLVWGCTGLWVAWRARTLRAVGVFVLASLPFLALHHAVNFSLCGSWKPANTFPQLLTWPGSPFNTANMTGGLSHDTLWAFLYYAGKLLIGSKGFLCHQLPLLLVMVAVVVLPYKRHAELPEITWAMSWTIGAWLLYSVASNNASGSCVSVRWFVPFLPAWYFVIGTLLHRFPIWWPDFRILSGGAFVVAAIAWSQGPWSSQPVWGYWVCVGGILLVWQIHAIHRRRNAPMPYSEPIVVIAKAGKSGRIAHPTFDSHRDAASPSQPIESK